MEQRILAIDFETIPDMTRVGILPEVKPKGTLKDPVKIEADIKEKKQNQLKEMNLTPALNIICCAGYADNSGKVGNLMLEDEKSEKKLLENIWELYACYDHFVTFNGRNFDMRCLYLHSMLHGVRPSKTISSGRYNKGNHTDLRPVLSGEGQFAKGKLDFYANLFLDDHKSEGIDGSKVYDWWILGDKDYIAKYCEKDCILTYRLYEKAVKSGLIDALNS